MIIAGTFFFSSQSSRGTVLYFRTQKKKINNPASLIGLPEGADCVGTADGTVDAGLLWLASLVDGVLVVVGWVGVPVVGLLRVIPAI